MFSWRLPGMLIACITTLLSSQVEGIEDLKNLKQDQVIASFKVENLYENETGRIIGGRFRHIQSGFVLDLLRIQSLPQAFMWVNSFPPSNMGEPHTCEHLMLGKGSRGRYVGSLEEMSLGNSSAFTGQLQTCYHFHTAAGPDVFFKLMEAKLEALIHPDFSDEEIRREVCNMGYSIDPVDSSLRLEEKGTVYNEMVSSYERPWGYLGRELGVLLYGPDHPLSNDSGGYPDSIRQMVPSDMRAFIEKNYHISNMGMIVSLDDKIELNDCLEKISSILTRVEPDAAPKYDPAKSDDLLPAPQSGPDGKIEIVRFPAQNGNEPGLLLYAWPPSLEYDNRGGFLLELLMGNLASGETSNLFRKFIDSQTRVMNIGANAVFEWVSSEKGHPIYIGFNNLSKESCSEAAIDTVRRLILEELDKVGSFADGSPELAAFNERAQNRIIERRRDLRNFLNSPPGFGYRGTGDRWMEHLKHLQNTGDFRKRLTLDDELNYAESLLASKRNFWKDYIAKWKLSAVKPYAVASCPDTDLLRQISAARDKRIDAFVAGLEEQYGTKDSAAAVGRFKREYDAKSAIIDSSAAQIAMPKFIDNPPLSLDDQLRYAVDKLPGGGPLVNSAFDNMTSATIGLAFNMNVVPESLLFFVGALPTLLTESGVVKGKPYPFDEMKEAIRREILDLRAYYSVNNLKGRVELVIRGSGGDRGESEEALKWMEATLFDPIWTVDNLPRMRDAVDLALADLRNTMRGSEESWVDDPANAYWRQSNPLLLNANCFLTQIHSFHRLRWLLKDPDSETAAHDFSMFMEKLAAFGEQSDRQKLGDLLSSIEGNSEIAAIHSPGLEQIIALKKALPESANALVLDAVHDLKQNLSDFPDMSLAEDWRYLCQEMDADLQTPASSALADLQNILNLLRHTDNVRAFAIGNSQDLQVLRPEIDRIVTRLSPAASIRQTYDATPRIISRLQKRMPSAEKPIFIGLINDNTRLGVFLNSAPCASFHDTDPDKLLTFLSARLYGGGGAHSMFMKTWSAGLAYSNGLRSNEFTGRLIYYAERCPNLPQTMQFVVNELKNAPRDPSLAEYAVAQAFGVYRSGSRYEARGEAMAADLTDGLAPDTVRRFRSEILDLRKDPNLYDKLYSRMEDTYGEVLPGYGPTAEKINDVVYFIIGPESQFRSYEEYLHSVEGNFTLYRLYPRDFWILQPLPKPAAKLEKNVP